VIAIHPDRIRIPAALWAGFKFLGITPTDVARHLRLPVTMLAEHATVTTAQYFALWQAASDLTHDLAAGIKLSTHLDAGVMPPAFIAVKKGSLVAKIKRQGPSKAPYLRTSPLPIRICLM